MTVYIVYLKDSQNTTFNDVNVMVVDAADAGTARLYAKNNSQNGNSWANWEIADVYDASAMANPVKLEGTLTAFGDENPVNVVTSEF